MPRPWGDRTLEAIELLKQVSREFGVDAPTLRDQHARQKLYVSIRREFCIRGRAMKIGVIELGIALNRDHTTICYHANAEMRVRKELKRLRLPRAELRRRRDQKMAMNSEMAAT